MRTTVGRAALRLFALLLLVCAGLLPRAASAVGETFGSVSGYVYDPTGAPLSEVPLTISGTALLRPISRTSGEDGRYEFDLLPPGDDYSIEVAVPGFTPIRQKGIHVRLGQASSVDVNLTVLTETQAVQTFQIVERVNPIINAQSTQATTVVTSEKAAESPQFSQTEGIPQQVAGTSFSNTPVTRGGLKRYGRFYVDGLDTTDITDGSMTGVINFYSVDNFEVITGGFDAQYNSMGMVENVVTKSGSNRFTYDLVLTLSPTFLTTQQLGSVPALPNTAIYTNNANPGPQTSFYSPVLSVGGPIIQDKLWFYASYQVNLSHKESPISTAYTALENRPTDTVTNVGRLKLTWQPTTKDRLSVTFNIDHNTIDNSTASGAVTDDAETRIDRGGVMIIANYDHNFTDDILFQLETGFTYKNVNNDPEHPSQTAGHFDTFNGVETLNTGRLSFGNDENYLHEGKARVQVGPSLVWKLRNHQMKAGVQFEYMADQQIQGVYGNSRFTDHPPSSPQNCNPTDPVASTACFEKTDFYSGVDPTTGAGVGLGQALTTNASVVNLGLFLQDRWTVNRKLTLIPGFRVDYGAPKGDSTSSSQPPSLVGVGPRLSGTYDVFGDRKSLITAHYGRSNDMGDVFLAQHANPALYEVNSFFSGGSFPACTGNKATDPQPPPGALPICTTAGGLGGRTFAPNQLPPYVDEVQLGYIQEIAPATALGINLDYRHYGRMWVDEEVNRIFDPSGNRVVGYVNGTAQSILLSRTTPAAYRNYEGVDVYLQGNPGRWDLLASYTLSFNHGTVSDYFDGFMADPRMNQFSNGFLSDDHRHTFKGSIAYNFPFGLDIGLRMRYQTGANGWETFANAADSNLNFYHSPRGTGFPMNPATGFPNFNDPTQWSQVIGPDWFQIDAQARYNLGAALGLKQHIEVALFLLDALDNYDPASEGTFYSPKGINKYGLTSFRNGPLQGEIILRFRN